LINDSEKEISIKDNDIVNPFLIYNAITYNSKDNKCYLDDTNTTKQIGKIPSNYVIFFETKIKGNNFKLNENILKEKLYLKDMMEEPAVVLCKMIIYHKYFYELYLN